MNYVRLDVRWQLGNSIKRVMIPLVIPIYQLMHGTRQVYFSMTDFQFQFLSLGKIGSSSTKTSYVITKTEFTVL